MTDSLPALPADAASAALIAGTDGDPPYAAPDVYNPADYRWVPVRRQPRRDGWTEEKQRRFIETLADTGIVGLAAKAVGMTRESAYRLRRSAHAAAFARAWDAARHHAGSLIEDIAFERAIEGVEHNVYDEYGEAICTKRVYNDRLLTFLLRHLKPERYAQDAPARAEAAPPPTVDATLREMEPQLPAPAEALLDPATLADELYLADISDGVLPFSLAEQRAPKTEAMLHAERIAAQQARGEAAFERLRAGDTDVSRQDMIDITRALDPASRNAPPRRRFR